MFNLKLPIPELCQKEYIPQIDFWGGWCVNQIFLSINVTWYFKLSKERPSQPVVVEKMLNIHNTQAKQGGISGYAHLIC